MWNLTPVQYFALISTYLVIGIIVEGILRVALEDKVRRGPLFLFWPVVAITAFILALRSLPDRKGKKRNDF
jgi:hypothetical protein